ncbi:unnamed protein product [Periconia digitata]|uniref:O-methyltransferase C-terminal domain-containing protein n=1 Tax=Periconia digitata TaxID=1303443 RepID=A0A9W4UBK7_9PLEO|nr:unnamed protein product [Periconia digitata]
MSAPTAINPQQREGVLESATKIKQLSQEPGNFLIDLLVQQQQFTSIKWLLHFKIPEMIPVAPKGISYDDLSSRTGISSNTIRAVARMAMTADFLAETKDGLSTHSQLSRSLVEDQDLANWLSYVVNRNVPMTYGFIEATERWPNTTSVTETAFNVSSKTELSFFDWLEANPKMGTEFGEYMKSQAAATTDGGVEHLVNGFDWKSLGKATIVDVGGGEGDASFALVHAYPELRLIVQDLSHAKAGAQAKIAALDAPIKSRVEWQEYDFREVQQVKGADVYFLRTVLHNWPDDGAVKILQRVVEAMGPSSRIIIMDMVLPTPGDKRVFEGALRQKDLMMRQAFNAPEREVEDWYSLVGKVDKRLELVAITRPEGSVHSLLEIKLRN